MKPFVSVVVPLLNEEAYIERLARSLLDQDYPRERYEILVADGGSTDGTLDLLRRIDAEGRVRVLPNPGRTAPAALNVLIAASRGEIVTRVDGHSRVALDYLTRIVEVMAETGESVVGGPVLLEADTPFRRALVEALLAPVGVGSVPYRTLRHRTHVESLQTGSFRREVLAEVGPFDESLAVVEDLDMNTRIRKSGRRLLLDPSIRFWYYPRPGLRPLFRQIFTVGRVKAWILRKHPDIRKLKYYLPALFVIGTSACAIAVLARPFGGSPGAARAGASALGLYAVAVGCFAASRAPRLGAGALRLLAILPVLHVGYGAGFLVGAFEAVTGKAAGTSEPAVNDHLEARVLLAVLGGRWDEAAALRRGAPADPARFVALARGCDVHPQVDAALRARDGFDLAGGPEAERAFGELRRKVQRDNLLLLALVEPALDRLLAAGVVPVALKGLDILHRFPIRFDERTLEDADLLVARRDLPRALEALESAGWTAPPEPARTHWLRSSFEMPLRSPGPVAVHLEIHWSLAQQRRYRVDEDALLRRAVPLTIAGRPVLRLDDHDAAAHLLLHHVQHYFDRRLKWAIDLARIAREPGFDWPTVAERATEWGGSAAAGMAAAHLRTLFPGIVPDAVAARLPVALWRRAFTLPLRSRHPLDYFHGTRRRAVQLWLAAAALERPADLPGYLRHRSTRDRRDEAG